MGMDLARKDFGTTPEYFIAGATIRIAKAVKVAGADIPAHSPVTLDGDTGSMPGITKWLSKRYTRPVGSGDPAGRACRTVSFAAKGGHL